MDRATRSRVMSRIRGKDTGPERIIAEVLAAAGLEAEQQVRDLPGRPDFVLRDARVAIFVDGDFWHGWRFSRWRHKLSKKWEQKIEANRRRDMRNHARLKRAGWTVVRVWQHQIESDIDTVRLRLAALRTSEQR
jgi:DNA mismatch endonuclease (patch repair protein)